jgi:thymidylate synthase (FAD)
MKIITPSAHILTQTPYLEEVVEAAGRVCWKSEERIQPGSAKPFIENLKNLKHESVLEHGAITVRFVIDRGISHELVRHRLASYSQESTRYCNYGKDSFGGEIAVIDLASGFKYDLNNENDLKKYRIWQRAMASAEYSYFEMLDADATPQEARSVLPNSTKTEVIMTCNPREWRHVFKLRCASSAHPQIREVMIPLLHEFAETWPALFEDLVSIELGN